jgi:outer membrane protein OmpA-like peptidoglycan-associated protein
MCFSAFGWSPRRCAKCSDALGFIEYTGGGEDRMKQYRGWPGAAAVAGLAMLTACDPVASYRDLRGFSKTDPNPATTPFAANLASGLAAPYPNLATVPPPPTREMTASERQAMLQSLNAERARVDRSDQRLRAGIATAEAPGPVPPPPPLPPGVSAKLPPAPPGAKPAKRAAGPGPRKAGEKPEPGPPESSLKMPEIGEVPAPEAFTAPPPPPHLPPPDVKAAAAGPMPPPAPSLPAAIAASPYEPPPPPPQVPPIAAAAPAPGRVAKPPPAAGRPVGEIDFAAGSTSLTAQDRPILDKLAALYRETPGHIRILGRAAGGGNAAEELKRYRIALDRAQAVAAALRERGIPASKIRTQAAAVNAGGAEDRAEVVLEP